MTDEQNTSSTDFKRLPFADKLSGFRTEVQNCDWKPDKFLNLGNGKGFPYISSDKVRITVSPILAKYGLEFTPEFSELTMHPGYGNVANHWTVKLKGTIKDYYSGQEYTASVYGENGSSDDKGVVKAQTAAVKKFFIDTQLLADGIDESVDAYTSAGGQFVKKTPEEQEEIRSKVLSSGIAPNKPAVPNRPKPAPAKQAPAKPAEKPAEAPKADEPAKEEKPADEPEKPKESNESGVHIPDGIPAIHRTAITKIVETWTERAKTGAVGPEEFNEMSMACAEVQTQKDAVKFISKYKVE